MEKYIPTAGAKDVFLNIYKNLVIHRLFHCFLILLPCTCVRAQLRPNPPAFTFLADQLTEMGYAGGIPNGDFGPSRLALGRHLNYWMPGYLAASWKGDHPWHTGIGGIAAHSSTVDFYRNAAFLSFGGGEDQQALSLFTNPFDELDLSAGFSYVNDNRFRDDDANGHNDLAPGHSLLASMFGRWHTTQYDGTAGFYYFESEQQRQGRTNERVQQLTIDQTNRFRGYSDIVVIAKLLLNAEKVDRDFATRQQEHRRLTGSFNLEVRPDYYDEYFRWSVLLDVVHREDQLIFTGSEYRLREQYVALSGNFSYDYAPFRFRYNQQLLSSRTDSVVYRPNAQIVWHHRFADLYLTGIVNRGGGYRNPLLSDGNLAFSRRENELGELRSEDFWRRGFNLQLQPTSSLRIDVQAFWFDYNRHTVARYTPDNMIRVEQTGGTKRRLVAAQANYVLPFGITYRSRPLALYTNYRFDEISFENAEGLLLPARHAAWVRLEIPLDFRTSSRDLKTTLGGSYLRQSSVEGLSDAAAPLPVRDRLDFSLRVQFKDYWLGLRGEQLLRSTPLYAYGFDPLAPGEELPLGSEFSVLTGRRVTLTAGIGIRRN